jgi:hypothetical protein
LNIKPLDVPSGNWNDGAMVRAMQAHLIWISLPMSKELSLSKFKEI